MELSRVNLLRDHKETIREGKLKNIRILSLARFSKARRTIGKERRRQTKDGETEFLLRIFDKIPKKISS